MTSGRPTSTRRRRMVAAGTREGLVALVAVEGLVALVRLD